MLGCCQNWIFEQKFDFSNSVHSSSTPWLEIYLMTSFFLQFYNSDIVRKAWDTIFVGVLRTESWRGMRVRGMRYTRRPSCGWFVGRISWILGHWTTSILASATVGARVARNLFRRSIATAASNAAMKMKIIRKKSRETLFTFYICIQCGSPFILTKVSQKWAKKKKITLETS